MLLHDIHKRTAEALPVLLRELKKRGYRIVHVVPAGGAVAKIEEKPEAKTEQTAVAKPDEKTPVSTEQAAAATSLVDNPLVKAVQAVLTNPAEKAPVKTEEAAAPSPAENAPAKTEQAALATPEPAQKVKHGTPANLDQKSPKNADGWHTRLKRLPPG